MSGANQCFKRDQLRLIQHTSTSEALYKDLLLLVQLEVHVNSYSTNFMLSVEKNILHFECMNAVCGSFRKKDNVQLLSFVIKILRSHVQWLPSTCTFRGAPRLKFYLSHTKNPVSVNGPFVKGYSSVDCPWWVSSNLN